MTWLLMCLAIRGRKLDISLVFITQTYFAVPKDSRQNFTLYFIMKIPSVFKNLSDIYFLCIFTKNLLQNHILFRD